MRETDQPPGSDPGGAETPVQGPPVGGRDWTQGSIARNLLRLSAPMIVNATLNLLGSTIDMIWIGKLGTAAVAGVGDTFWAMVFSLITVWVVQVPLAFLLPGWTGLGVYGVRWAIVIAITVGGIAYTLYFRSGRWKRKRL